VTGVYAAATFAFSVNNTVSFNAVDIDADVSLSATNNGAAVDFGGGQMQSVVKISADDDASKQYVLSVPKQVINSEKTNVGLTYELQVKNTGSRDLTVNLDGGSKNFLANIAGVTVTYAYQMKTGTTDFVSSLVGAVIPTGSTYKIIISFKLADKFKSMTVQHELTYNFVAIQRL
ncbi:MAG: hypothetical protein RR400_03515, partial [Clostridia bacterium]